MHAGDFFKQEEQNVVIADILCGDDEEMNNLVKKIMVSAIKTRMNNGETLDDILDSYPKLTKEEKQELREAIN